MEQVNFRGSGNKKHGLFPRANVKRDPAEQRCHSPTLAHLLLALIKELVNGSK